MMKFGIFFLAGLAAAMATSANTDVEECTAAINCKCQAGKNGFKTYTFKLDGQQRCFTVFNGGEKTPHPVMFSPQCYAQDRLAGMDATKKNSHMNKAATRYGFARIFVSTPDRNWQFGNDNIVNDNHPMPCDDKDSKDIAYIRKIVEWIRAHPKQFDSTKMYTDGFSQNSMFAAYIGFCFKGVRGIWQGGSGLTLKGEQPIVPNAGGHLAYSSYLKCKKEKISKQKCIEKYPCKECQYWPIYPCYSPVHPKAHCIAEYTNDFISSGRKDPENQSSSKYMCERSDKEGHQARLLRFTPSKGKDNTIKGGHKQPPNAAYWKMGCLGITAQCNKTCEKNFAKNVGYCATATKSAMERAKCFVKNIENKDSMEKWGCKWNCAPTYKMLTISQEPEAIVKTWGATGERNKLEEAKAKKDSLAACPK